MLGYSDAYFLLLDSIRMRENQNACNPMFICKYSYSFSATLGETAW